MSPEVLKHYPSKKFDRDLTFGKQGEEWLANLKKVEVKRERDRWRQSGNIYIEVQCHGRDSGINATKADNWVHLLSHGEQVIGGIIVQTSVLQDSLNRLVREDKARVRETHHEGDNPSVGLVIPYRFWGELFFPNGTPL